MDCASSEKYYFSQNNIRDETSPSSSSGSSQASLSSDPEEVQQAAASAAAAAALLALQQQFTLVPVGSLPPVRFPGSGQNEINVNRLPASQATADDFDLDYLADYLDTPSTTTRRPRPR